MISLELARELKNSGLKWEPKVGDWLYYDDRLELLDKENLESTKRLHNLTTKHQEYQDMAPVFAPTLPQLLAEIEGRGYVWEIHQLESIFKLRYECSVKSNNKKHSLYADTLEDATGQALLWILKGVGRDG